MNEELAYLKDFSKRLTSLAIPYRLAVYAENKVKDYRRNSISNEMFYLMIHFVLLYIEQQNISKKDCTKDDITSELTTICREFNIEIDSFELATDIINHCCENDGERQYFDPSLFNISLYEIRLIKGENIFKEGRYVTRYELTPQGINYIYYSKEILEFGQVDIEHIKLQKSIKMGNYSEAKNNVNSLIIAIDNQRKEIEYNKRKIISNIFEIDIKSIMNDIFRTYELINEQRMETRHILDLLKEHVALSQNTTNANMSSGLKDMAYVELKVTYILNKQFELIEVLQDFNKTLNEELIDASFLSERNNLNILEDIIKPLENDVKGEINPFLAVQTLLGFTQNEFFDIQMLFEEQPVTEEKEGTNVEITDVEFPDKDTSVDIQMKNERYEKIFVSILDHLDTENETALSEILDKTDALNKNITCTKVVLTNLIVREEIVFDDMQSFDAGGDLEYFGPEYLHKNSKQALSGKRLKVYSKNIEDEIAIVEEAEAGSIIRNSLRLPNLYFMLISEEQE